MKTLADPNPVHVHLDADLPKVTGAMADYNLLVLLVLDHDDHLIACPDHRRHPRSEHPPEWRRRRE